MEIELADGSIFYSLEDEEDKNCQLEAPLVLTF
jgi:hypothetical protein